jgi:MFS family permease
MVLAASGSDYQLVFLVAFVLSALPLYVLARHLPADRPAPAVAAAVRAQSAPVPADDPPSPTALALATLGLLITGTAYMVSNLFPVLATEHGGLSEGQAGSIFGLAALLAFTAPGFGWLSDHVSQKLVLSIRSVANTASSLAYLLFPNLAGFATGRALDDMGKAAFRPAWGALMAQAAAADPAHRARTMSVISLGDDAGEVVGPILAGILWTAWGVEGLLLTRLGLGLIAEVYSIRLGHRLRVHGPRPDAD